MLSHLHTIGQSNLHGQIQHLLVEEVHPFQGLLTIGLFSEVIQFTKMNSYSLVSFVSVFQRLHNQHIIYLVFTFCYSMLVYPTRSYLIIFRSENTFSIFKSTHCRSFCVIQSYFHSIQMLRLVVSNFTLKNKNCAFMHICLRDIFIPMSYEKQFQLKEIFKNYNVNQ